mmetsp:Transcript_571/g.1282  ORF Transcript_571/g.1282 Transcript_571/m.1282 type:complete len:216 (+) Transcript_571:214-861(+)
MHHVQPFQPTTWLLSALSNAASRDLRAPGSSSRSTGATRGPARLLSSALTVKPRPTHAADRRLARPRACGACCPAEAPAPALAPAPAPVPAPAPAASLCRAGRRTCSCCCCCWRCRFSASSCARCTPASSSSSNVAAAGRYPSRLNAPSTRDVYSADSSRARSTSSASTLPVHHTGGCADSSLAASDAQAVIRPRSRSRSQRPGRVYSQNASSQD